MNPIANFFHCASHCLNLVINDLNSLAEVRNCIGKIKEVTTFVRDRSLRRNIVGSIWPNYAKQGSLKNIKVSENLRTNM